jgi:hypothetical protein
MRPKRKLSLYRPAEYWRPSTRGECREGVRPCPFVGCRHHLYLEVSKGGGLRLNFPELEPHELTESCSLDVAERGEELILDAVGETLDVNGEMVRQIEVKGLRKLEPALRGIDL